MAAHVCINCSKPTPTLYKVYSTPGSIQLTTCKNCGHDVDKYIERELLLVIMDCVLHRPEAFRHLLYNRNPFSDFDLFLQTPIRRNNFDENATTGSYLSSFGGLRMFSCVRLEQIKTLTRYSLSASLLRTFLWNVARVEGSVGSAGYPKDRAIIENIAGAEALTTLLAYVIGDIVLVTTTIICSHCLLPQKNGMSTGNNDGRGKNEAIRSKDVNRCPTEPNESARLTKSRLFLALIIPVFFHVVTVFVLVWENSSTVFLLGTLFVLSMQHMGVSIVVEERALNCCNCKIEYGGSIVGLVKCSFPFMTGLIARTLVMSTLIPLLIFDVGEPCTGIQVKSTFDVVESFHFCIT